MFHSSVLGRTVRVWGAQNFQSPNETNLIIASGCTLFIQCYESVQLALGSCWEMQSLFLG